MNTLLKRVKVALPLHMMTLFPSLRSGIELAYFSLLFAYAKKALGLFFITLDKECS